ncbi:fimbrial protein [Serratia marcescens]|uniref:fimbrial protein n=1 Tax=Serratia marcescens TaxID=615 RepID=UPI0007C98D54|nr:fimbrial protein [Serratia marcescens]OAH32767.1 pilus assembly protein [Serratia marcescens]
MKRVMIALLLAGVCGTGQAKDGEADMTFRGKLIAPPSCTINDGGQVDVDFGAQVGIHKVDGNNYRQTVNYQITCDKQGAGEAPGTLMLSLDGTATGFDKDALATKKEDLGVRVYLDSKPFTPNSRIAIDLNHPPVLEAVPVKNAGATLAEGEFEAWATLRAEYQ